MVLVKQHQFLSLAIGLSKRHMPRPDSCHAQKISMLPASRLPFTPRLLKLPGPDHLKPFKSSYKKYLLSYCGNTEEIIIFFLYRQLADFSGLPVEDEIIISFPGLVIIWQGRQEAGITPFLIPYACFITRTCILL